MSECGCDGDCESLVGIDQLDRIFIFIHSVHECNVRVCLCMCAM